MSRTGQQRLDAIQPAIDRRDAFQARVKAAADDWCALADLMAEAITMQIDANHLEPVGKNGKATICIEEICAAHCLIDAKNAYLTARYGNREAA
jgi:hypothetical protein